MIDDNLLLVEKNDEIECILNELYRTKKYYINILYKFGIYDEEENSVMLWQLIKVSIFLII